MDIIISNSSGKPIYEQIVLQIKEGIITGRLKPGEALPSMRNLAMQLRISIITTKRAYEELEREGFIESAGSGASPGGGLQTDGKPSYPGGGKSKTERYRSGGTDRAGKTII